VVDQLMTGQRTFSHILFDLDHTLSYYPLSTGGVVTATFDRLRLSLESFGPAYALASRYDALWVALERDAASTDELRLTVWRRLLMERGLSADGLAERIAAEYGAVRRANGVCLFDGTRDLLFDLRAAGYGLGLLTNGLSDGQWEKIRSLRIEPHFDAVVVAGDVDVYKPDPRAFAVLLDRLGARAPRALFVGDSYEMDILGAHAAGLATAWVRPEGTPLPGDVVPQFAFPRAVDVREVIL
jgi:HAD superfamily hydrolase (TIGR01549 family)